MKARAVRGMLGQAFDEGIVALDAGEINRIKKSAISPAKP